MSSISHTFRVRLPMIVTIFVSRIASGTVFFALLAAASPVVAHDAEGFMVLPGGGARFPGPVGQEANIAEILARGEQTGGVWGVWRYTAAPKFGPPLHTHGEEDELFYVLSGEFAIQLGECVEVAPAGSFVFIPKDAPHTYRNMRAEPGELLGIVSPAGLEGLFEALHGADPATAEELLKRHAMSLVGPQIDLDALPQDRGAAAQAMPAADAYRIGVLAPGCDPPSPTLESFLQALRDRGYTEGQNLVTEWRYSEGDAERFAGLAEELSGLDLDVIVTISTPAALAAKQATKTVPIVMLYVADPQGTGLVPSLARPGGNITGVSDMATDLSAKRLSLLKEAVPALSRVAVLWNSADPGMVLRFEELEAAAQELEVTLESFEVRGVGDFTHAFSAMIQEDPDALFVIAEVLTIANRCRVLQFAKENRLPAIYEFGLFAQEGGLMAYGPKLTDSFERGAYYVDEILKGAEPSELPVEQPANFELIVNLATAESLELTLPPAILLQAEPVDGVDDGRCARIW